MGDWSRIPPRPSGENTECIPPWSVRTSAQTSTYLLAFLQHWLRVVSESVGFLRLWTYSHRCPYMHRSSGVTRKDLFEARSRHVALWSVVEEREQQKSKVSTLRVRLGLTEGEVCGRVRHHAVAAFLTLSFINDQW